MAKKPASLNTCDSNTPRIAKRAIPTTEATSPSRTATAIQPRRPRVSCHRRRSKYISGSVLKTEHNRGVRNQKQRSRSRAPERLRAFHQLRLTREPNIGEQMVNRVEPANHTGAHASATPPPPSWHGGTNATSCPARVGPFSAGAEQG